MSSVRLVALVVAFAVTAGALVAAPPPASAQVTPPPFVDDGVIAGVHRPAVYELVAAGVVAGCGDGAFCPDAPVTREQMASFIGRALGLRPDPSPRFDDVAPTSTHGGFVGALAGAGITEGCAEEGRYCPTDPVNREQMATFLTRAYALVPGAAAFTDVGGGVHAPGVGAVAAARITTGCTSSTFCPRDHVTREQMASFIARAMGLLRDGAGCPTTDGPASTVSLGAAAEGFPVNAAERVGERLHVFSLGLRPSRIVTYDLRTRRVVRTTQVPSGDRTWAVHSPEGSDLLYFGQDAAIKTLYRFDTATGSLRSIGTIPDVTEVWDMTSDDQGRLYIGTSERNGTVWRYDPEAAPAARLRELHFVGDRGQSVQGQVTQVDWADGVLYVGTGRGTARLLAIDTDGWEPGPANAATAYRLPGVSGFGVYALEVSDGVIAAGLENWQPAATVPANAALTLLDRPEPVDPDDPDDPADPDAPDTGEPDGPADPDEPDDPDAGDPDGDPDSDQPGEPAPDDPGADDPGADGGDPDQGDPEDPADPDGLGAAAVHASTDPTPPTERGPSAAEVAGSVTLRGGAPLVPAHAEGAFTAVAIDTAPAGGDTVYAAGRGEGTIYRVDPASTTLVDPFEPSAPPAPLSPTRALFVHDGRLLGVAAPAMVWHSDLGTASYDSSNLVTAGAPSEPARPQSLAAGNGRIAVGSNNALAIHRPGQGRSTLAVSGEPKAMETVGPELYLGLYPSGTLRRVDLSGSYPGQTVDSWDDAYGRPTDLHHDAGGSGRLQVSAQVTQNSSARGALTSYRRQGGGFGSPTTYQQSASERGASAVTTWNDLTILGGTGSSARVVARTTGASDATSPQWSAVPVPGGGSVTSLVTVGARVHGMTQDGTWFSLDPRSGAVTGTRRVFSGGAGHVVTWGGWLYAVTRDCLVAIDPKRQRAETLQRGLNATTFGTHTVTVSPGSPLGSADAYVIRGSDLVRVRHTQR
jgi:hypothetical protein